MRIFFRLLGIQMWFICLQCLLTAPVRGQDIQGNVSVYTEAPSVGALDKFMNTPVSLYTGVPEVSISVYTIRSKDIEVPISFSYHAGGIKVDEEAGDIGLGWDLTCGGTIYRSILGKDDLLYSAHDAVYLDATAPDFTKYVPLTQEAVPAYEVPVLLTNGGGTSTLSLVPWLNPNTTSDFYPKDFQPDEFSVSLPGYSGKFIIDRSGKVLNEHRDNTRIELIRNQADRFDVSWVVTTGDGYRYYLNDIERVVPHPNSGVQPEYISAWRLTRIESPQGAKVSFVYADETQWLVPNLSNFYEQVDKARLGVRGEGGSGSVDPHCQILTALDRLAATDYKNKRLQRVEFQNGKLMFEYSDRVDKVGGKLDRILLVTLQDRPVQDFTFGYGYFMKNAAAYKAAVFEDNDFTAKRLRLESFTRNMGGNKEIFSFQYNEALLPPKYSLDRDHWGFFNGENYNTSLIPSYRGRMELINQLTDVSFEGANRETSQRHSQAFALQRIIYPTGGHTSFEYESNDYDMVKSGYDVNNVEYGLLRKQVDYYRSGEGNVPKRLKIVIPATDAEDDGYVRVKTKVAIVKSTGLPSSSYAKTGYYKIKDAAGVVFADQALQDDRVYTVVNPTNLLLEGSYALLPGVYYLEVYLDNTIDWILNATVSMEWMQKPTTALTSQKIHRAGGLRAKRIVDYDNITRQENVRTFVYGQQSPNGEYHSYGRLMGKPRYYEYPATYLQFLTYCEHFVLSASSNTELFSGSGVTVGYDTVVTIYGKDDVQMGKSVSIFHNQVNVGSFSGQKQRPSGLHDWHDLMNGRTIRELSFAYRSETKGYEIVSEKEFEYKLFAPQTAYGVFVRPGAPESAPHIDRPPLDCFFYPGLQSAWVRLDRQLEKIYSPGQVFTREKFFTYEATSRNYMAKSDRTISSDGAEITQEYYYATDFMQHTQSIPFALATENNFVNMPLETVRKLKRDGKDWVIGGAIMEFKQLSVDEGAPARIYPFVQRKLDVSNSIPAVQFVPWHVNNVAAPGYRLESQYYYDSIHSTLSRIRSRVNPDISYSWGYHYEYPIAQCTNARPGEFFYTGFEDTGTVGDAHTGERFYPGDYTVPFEPPVGRQYRYSFWYRENGAWLFSGLLVYIGPLTIQPGDAIDDIRVHPVDATLSTFSHEILKGLGTLTDPNNQTTYFRYDSRGRLDLIRNAAGEIEKQYKYHYRVNR